jgi:hypothetical protein
MTALTVMEPVSMDEKFGVLKRVDLRHLWPHEALDFSPWLAQNLDTLGEVLGMDLELQLQEAPVGPFSLDLLVHDLGRERVVIIENQIEPTNHDHLGKLLTYAAGHDAAVAVWIASEFREEHRQALDWLNQRSDATTQFFGIVVEALQIDDSRPACNFRLVAFPNDWRKSNVATISSKPSPRAEAYQSFFQNLIDRLRTKHKFTQARKGQPQNWYTFSSGLPGIGYSVSFTTGNRVRTEAYIDNGDGSWNTKMFDGLYQQRGEIEDAFGESLDWERLDARRACRIAVYRPGSIDDPPQTLEEIRDWGIDRLLRFKAAIGPRASELITYSQPSVPGDAMDIR